MKTKLCLAVLFSLTMLASPVTSFGQASRYQNEIGNTLQESDPQPNQEASAGIPAKLAEGEDTMSVPFGILPFREQGPARPRFATNDPAEALLRSTNANPTNAATLLFAELVTNPSLVIVEREEMDKLVEELELSAAGMIDSATSNRIGKMIGAKILITGSVMQTESKLYVIVKIIGTETSRVLGASAKGNLDAGVDPLIKQVANDVTTIIKTRSGDLLPKEGPRIDRIANLKNKLENAKLPSVCVKIAETHEGIHLIDPAAQTEIVAICKQLGFTVYDVNSSDMADIIITGEALSESSSRRKNFFSVKGRVELRATDRSSGKILHADRRTVVNVELTEKIAGKSAIQEAALQIAEDLLPKIVTAK